MADWYEKNIEVEIRPLVRLLRDNGFNTFNSCGHAMVVSCECYIDGDVTRLKNLLDEHGYSEYKVRLDCSRFIDPETKACRRQQTLTVYLPMKNGFFAD